MTVINTNNEFLKNLEKNLFDLKKEILKRNNSIDEVNTLIWMVDSMRNSIGEEMLKTLETVKTAKETKWEKLISTFPAMQNVPKTPWKEIYEKTEYIWTYCNRCGWRDYIKKSKRDDPCPVCRVFDLKQRCVIAKINCKECGWIGYATQGVLRCIKCNSKNISVIQKREVLRTLYGRVDTGERAKDTWINPWHPQKKNK